MLWPTQTKSSHSTDKHFHTTTVKDESCLMCSFLQLILHKLNKSGLLKKSKPKEETEPQVFPRPFCRAWMKLHICKTLFHQGNI